MASSFWRRMFVTLWALPIPGCHGFPQKKMKRVSVLPTPFGGKQTMVVITESGLYTLILRSRKPEAKAFRRWVTGKCFLHCGAPALSPCCRSSQTRLRTAQTFSEAPRLLADTHDQAESSSTRLRPSGKQWPLWNTTCRRRHLWAAGNRRCSAWPRAVHRMPAPSTHPFFREGGHLQPYAEHLSAGFHPAHREDNDHAWVQTQASLPKGRMAAPASPAAQHTTLSSPPPDSLHHPTSTPPPP